MILFFNDADIRIPLIILAVIVILICIAYLLLICCTSFFMYSFSREINKKLEFFSIISYNNKWSSLYVAIYSVYLGFCRRYGIIILWKAVIFMAQITKDTIIMDVLAIDPGTAEFFFEIGMHCLGCPSASGESI